MQGKHIFYDLQLASELNKVLTDLLTVKELTFLTSTYASGKSPD